MIEAVGDYILVKPLKQQETRNGLIVPKTKKEYDLVEIIDTACDEFKNGEKVFTYLHCGNEIEWENEKYYLLDKQFIHAKLSE